VGRWVVPMCFEEKCKAKLSLVRETNGH